MQQHTEVRFIGIVHGDILCLADAPPFYDESERVGTLEIYPEYQDGLDGIAAGQTITVLFWLHLADRRTLKVYPRGDKARGLHGVFATRSPMRPNPIAVSELKVLAIQGNRVEVYGLDILDGTPILDIKRQCCSKLPQARSASCSTTSKQT
jgi:L-fuculose-phosphate aldolase